MNKLILLLFSMTLFVGCTQESDNSTPVAAPQDPRYAWVVESWTPCSVNIEQACSGSGDQTRQVYCKKDPGGYVSDSFCIDKIGANSKPALIKQCKSVEGQIESAITYSGVSVGSVTKSCREGETLPYQSTGYCTTGFRYVTGSFVCSPDTFTLTATSISPISPSNLATNNPLVKGKTSSLVSAVSFYSDASCSSSISIVNSSNILNLFNSSGINLALTPNVKQDIYIKMANPTYFLSSCVLFSKDYFHDNRSPVVTVTSRDNYINSLNSASYNLKGSCKDNFNLNFIKISNNTIIKTQACVNGTFDVNLDLSNRFIYPDGVFQLKLSQTDSANNIGEITVPINKDVETSVTLLSYSSSVNSVNEQSYPVSGSCDSGVVDFMINSAVVGTANCVSGTFTSSINLSSAPQGPSDLIYRITDVAGNILSKNVSITKDSVFPNLTITPLYGYINAENQNSPYVVSGSCESASGSTNVRIVRAETNQEIFNGPCVNSAFSYSFDFSSFLDQIYQYKISQSDLAGNEKVINFGVNKSSNKPSLYISATPEFANIQNQLISFTGECSVAGTVEISTESYLSSAQCSLNSATAKFEFSHSINFSSHIDGDISVLFSISDGSNIENKSITIIKDTVVPSIVITNSSLYSNASSFALTGTCSENGQPIHILDPLENEITTTCIGGNFSSVVSLQQLPQGPALFNIKHFDSVQNSYTQVFSIIKDTISPINASISYPIYIQNSTLPITVNYSDSNPISKLLVYTNETCSGMNQPINYSSASGSVYQYSHGIVGAQNQYIRFLSLKIEDAAGNATECLNYNLGKYTYVNKLESPTLTSLSPVSPNASAVVTIKGTVDSISNLIGIYSDSACLNSLYSGSPSSFISVSGQSLSVQTNHTTNFYAKSINSLYSLSSDCVNLNSLYTHDSEGPNLTAIASGSYINSSNQSDFSIIGTCEPNLFVYVKNLSDQDIESFICDADGEFSKILDLSNPTFYPESSTLFLKFEQTDYAGNKSSVTVSAFKDTQISLTNVLSSSFFINLANQSAFQISGECSDGIVKILIDTTLLDQSACPAGGGSFSKTFNLSGATEGNLNLNILLEDAAGNSVSRSLLLEKDTIAPTVTHSNNPLYVKNDLDIVFQGSCSEVGQQVDIINLYNNYHSTPNIPEESEDEDKNLCSETNQYSITMPIPNPESVMQFQIVHKDAAGNSVVLPVSITKDKTAPLITGTSHPTYIVGPTMQVSISYTEALSGVGKILAYTTANCSGTPTEINYTSPSNSIFTYTHGVVTSGTQEAFFSYRLVDRSGNQSASCGFNSSTTGKFTVINKLPAPTLTSMSPATSPSAISSPLLIGSVGSIANQISFYSDNLCSSLITQVSTSLFTSTGQTVGVSLNSSSSIYARTTISGVSAYSDCTSLVSNYIHDSIAPTVSSIVHSRYTGTSVLPVTVNYSDSNGAAKVRTYLTVDCSAAFVDVNYSGVTGSIFNYTHGKTTSSFISGIFSMKIIDAAGNASTCISNTSTAGQYIYISSLPGPTLTNSPPVSSNSSVVNLKGTVDSLSDEVSFYSNSSCSSTILPYSSISNFVGSSGQDLTINLNSTTTIYAKSRINGTSFESACKHMATYSHDSQSPIISSVSVPSIASSMPISFTINFTESNTISTIQVFENSICSGSPISTSVSVTGSSLTNTYAKSSPVNKTNYQISFKLIDGAGNESSCSGSSTVRFVNSLISPTGNLSTSLNYDSLLLTVTQGTASLDSDADRIQLYSDSSCSTLFGSQVSFTSLSSPGISSTVSGDTSLFARVSNSSTSLVSPCSSSIGFSVIHSSITAGFASACGISKSSSYGYCWGLNNNGQLGDGSNTDNNLQSLSTVKNSAMSPVPLVNISMGRFHTCAISQSGDAYCWGQNTYGQLGNSSTTSTNYMVPVPGIFKKIYAGDSFSCGIMSDDSVKCWGKNSNGQLGIGSIDSSVHSSPVTINDSTKYKELSLSIDSHACGVTLTGSVKCWGNNGNLQIGVASGSTTTPVLLSGSDVYSKIATGLTHTCGLLTSGAVKCWGGNTYRQLGNPSFSGSSTHTPQLVSGTYKTISAGGGVSCATSTSNLAFCWGDNSSYQIGQGLAGAGNSVYTSPTQVLNLTSVKDVKVARASACAQMTTGVVSCWGTNYEGQLGDGTNTDKYEPSTQIQFIVK